jgi:hypothetical protein
LALHEQAKVRLAAKLALFVLLRSDASHPLAPPFPQSDLDDTLSMLDQAAA